MKPSQNFVIIVAAGKGLRMGSKLKKQYLYLDGIPILTRTIMAFETCDSVHEIVLVVPEDDTGYCKTHILDPYEFTKKIHVTQGGKQRQESVLNGLEKVRKCAGSEKKAIVMIHDGVRPFIDQSIIEASLQMAQAHGACIPAVKIIDTVKDVDPALCIQKTINRETLYLAQTPQTFKLDLIFEAVTHAVKTGFSGTDDASLVEYSGHKVMVINGSKKNIKITTPEDLALGKYLLMCQSV